MYLKLFLSLHIAHIQDSTIEEELVLKVRTFFYWILLFFELLFPKKTRLGRNGRRINIIQRERVRNGKNVSFMVPV